MSAMEKCPTCHLTRWGALGAGPCRDRFHIEEAMQLAAKALALFGTTIDGDDISLTPNDVTLVRSALAALGRAGIVP